MTGHALSTWADASFDGCLCAYCVPCGPPQVRRYRQGVLITFRGTGLFYQFDFVTAMFALVTGFVILGTATTIVDLISVNLYRIRGGKLQLSATSKIIRAKRIERVQPEAVNAHHRSAYPWQSLRSPPLATS